MQWKRDYLKCIFMSFKRKYNYLATNIAIFNISWKIFKHRKPTHVKESGQI